MKVDYYITGEESSDGMTPWGARILESGTVGEFIDMVLKNEKEWGYIGIFDKTIEYLLLAPFGRPYMEYHHGESVNREELKDFENKKVIDIFAHGGWSRMDYLLDVEK